MELPNSPTGRYQISYYDLEVGAVRREYRRDEAVNDRIREIRADSTKKLEGFCQPSAGMNGTAPIQDHEK